MKLGIIGLPDCGKTTVYNALTGQDLPTSVGRAGGKLQVSVGIVRVPDPRVDDLSARYRPKKTTYASVTFTDIGGLEEGIGASGIHGPLRNELAKMDGLVHVVRSFDETAFPHPAGSVDPDRDRAAIESELMLIDLLTIEHRLERLRDDWRKARDDARRANEAETSLMERLHGHLDSERPLRELTEITTAELKTVRGYGLLSLKPTVVLLNIPDDAAWSDALIPDERPHTVTLKLHGRIEAEIAGLAPEDRVHFLAEYGIEEPGVARVIRRGYSVLGLQSFFTVGEDEVRAWTVPVGANAVEAASAIHTDLGRGFIRAEVTRYEDLVALGDMKAVKAAGKQRLEGRDYVVRNGDILNIRSGI